MSDPNDGYHFRSFQAFVISYRVHPDFIEGHLYVSGTTTAQYRVDRDEAVFRFQCLDASGWGAEGRLEFRLRGEEPWLFGNFHYGQWAKAEAFVGAVDDTHRPCPPGPPYPPGPPCPPEPPGPCPRRPEPPSEVIVDNPTEPLFRFTTLRATPPCPDPEVVFMAPRDPAQLGFYRELQELRPDERAGFFAAAEAFAATDDYVVALEQLGPIMQSLPERRRELLELREEQSLDSLDELVTLWLGDSAATFFTDPTTAPKEERLWQTVMALSLGAVVDRVQCDSLVECLQMLTLLKALLGRDERLVSADGRWRVLNAVPRLPNLVSPDYPSPLAGDSSEGWLRPVGLGVLELVHRTRVGYELGDYAEVVNVLPRELLDETERESHEERDVEQDDQRTEKDELEERRERATGDLGEAALRVLADVALQTSGDGSETFDGGVSVARSHADTRSTQDASSTVGSSAKHARALTERAAQHVGKNVRQQRRRSQRTTRSHERRRRIDNRGSDEPLLAFYRYFHEVFRCEVYFEGERLVLEAFVADPAAHYRRHLRHLHGIPIAPPKRLRSLAAGPADVTAKNYLELGSYYGLSELAAPPRRTLSVSVSVDSSPQTGARQVEIPTGFRYQSGRVVWLGQKDADPLLGFVGDQRFSLAPADGQGLDGASPPGGQVELKEIGQREGSVPVGLLGPVERYRVAVQLECVAVDAEDEYQAWQRDTYHALEVAFAEARRRYEARLRERAEEDARGDYRQVEHRSLRHQVLELLEERAAPDAEDDEGWAPRLAGMLAWDDMTYAFHHRPVYGPGRRPEPRWRGQALTDPDSRALFERFLHAGSARILLPVRPGWARTVLCYLWFGAPWLGSPQTTPTLAVDTPALTALAQGGHEHDGPIDCWTVAVPTTMLVAEVEPPVAGAGEGR